MALLDIFTAGAAKDAAAKNRNYTNYRTDQAAGLYDAARTGGLAALSSGYGSARDAIGAGFGQARTDLMGGLEPAIGALSDATQNAQGAIGSRTAAALGYYDPLMAAGNTYGARATSAADMAANALGLGGPGGSEAALTAFRSANPGYDFQVNQGLDAIARNANAAGMVASGNQLRESQQFGQGLADTTYGQWYDRLFGREQLYSPLQANAYGTAAAGKSGLQMNAMNQLSDLYSRYGTNLAGLYQGQGQGLADLAARGGLATADIFGREGSGTASFLGNLAGGQSGVYTGSIDPYTGANTNEANAITGASQNLWNLFGEGAKMLAGGGYLPGGSFKSFGQYAPKA